MSPQTFLEASAQERKAVALSVVHHGSSSDLSALSSVIRDIKPNARGTVVKHLVGAAVRDFWGDEEPAIRKWRRLAESPDWAGLSEKEFDLRLISEFVSVYDFVLKKIKHKLNPSIRKMWLPSESDMLTALVGEVDSSFGTSVAGQLMAAYLMSLSDREGAAERFRRFCDNESDVLSLLPSEIGARSYYSNSSVSAITEEDVMAVCSGHRWLTPLVGRQAASVQSVILVSCNALYLRKLAPLLALNMSAYPHLRFHIVITEDEGAAQQLLGEFSSLTQSIGAMRRSPADQCFSCSVMPALSGFDAATFAACARLLSARQVAEAYTSDIFIMDADMLIEADPRQFLVKARAFEVAGAASLGLTGLVPWRRLLAGSLHLSYEAAIGAFTREVVQYVVRGLRDGGTWYLDQNALTYACDSTGIFADGARFGNNYQMGRTIQSRGVCKSLLRDA